MPFTVSHVAAVLPFVGRRSASVLPVAGLVAGSMAPDYPWFLTGGRTAGLSHSALGLVTVDLVAGLVAVLLWRHLLAVPFRDLLPPRLGRVLPEPVRTRPADLPWLGLAVVVGSGTHVVWDGFTHPGRFGVRWIGWLAADHAGVPGHQWAQLASGAVGGLVVVGWVTRRLLYPRPTVGGSVNAQPSGRSLVRASSATATPAERVVALLVVLVALLFGLVIGLLTAPSNLESMLFRMVTRGGLSAGLGVLVVCLTWQVRQSRAMGSAASGR